MLKRILVGLSGTPFTPVAVRTAVELARVHGAELTGVTIVDYTRIERVGPVPIGGGSAAHDLAEHRLSAARARVEEEIGRFEEACKKAGVTACVDRETGETFQTLTSLWRYHDLTVIGLRGLFEYGVVDNPDDQVIRLLARGVRPLLAVAQQHRPIERVLVAYGGSMEAAKAMKQFCQMSIWPDAKVKIVCFGFSDDAATPLLDDAAMYCRSHGFETETENRADDTPHGLLTCAHECGADLIVMGSTARHKIFKFILGDTALYAMRRADVPLFLSQ